MPMQKQTKIWIAGAVLVLGLLVPSVLAIFFGIRAEDFKSKWQAAKAETQNLQSKLRAISPTAPELIYTEIPAKQQHVSTSTGNDSQSDSRLRELEDALIERDGIIASLQQQTQERTTNRLDKNQGRGRPQMSMEELKTKDPERYAEIQKYREEAKQKLNDSFARKTAPLVNKDTSGMTDEEKKEYNTMLQLLDETWRLAERAQSDLPRDERNEIRRTMFENMVILEPMLKNERQREFYNLGTEFGCSPEESLSLVNYLNDVIDRTTTRNYYNGFHRNHDSHTPQTQNNPQPSVQPQTAEGP